MVFRICMNLCRRCCRVMKVPDLLLSFAGLPYTAGPRSMQFSAAQDSMSARSLIWGRSIRGKSSFRPVIGHVVPPAGDAKVSNEVRRISQEGVRSHYL